MSNAKLRYQRSRTPVYLSDTARYTEKRVRETKRGKNEARAGLRAGGTYNTVTAERVARREPEGFCHPTHIRHRVIRMRTIVAYDVAFDEARARARARGRCTVIK